MYAGSKGRRSRAGKDLGMKKDWENLIIVFRNR